MNRAFYAELVVDDVACRVFKVMVEHALVMAGCKQSTAASDSANPWRLGGHRSLLIGSAQEMR